MNKNQVIQYVHKVVKSLMNKYVLLFALVLLFQISFAQKRTVTGTVTDEGGLPLIGASIKAEKTATVADIAGKFSISIPTETKTLSISYIGMEEQKVVIGDEPIVVKMKPLSTLLNDVVVIGYGTAKRKDLTGAISSISSKDIENTVSATFDQALQGKVAGVIVNQNSGQPGGGVSVQIRGIASINSGTDPLYVIDGVIVQGSSTGGIYLGNSPTGNNPLSTINPSDIASIDVLKDASAISIYGSQGSNGVIVITTKRGKIGAPKISFEGYYGFQQLPKELPLMNLQQFASFINKKDSIIGATPPGNFANPKYLGNGTNWQKAIFRTAPMYNGSVTVSGGDARTQYLFSGSYFSQQGIALGSDFTRGSLKINLDNKTTNWLKIGTSLNFSGIKETINTTNYDLLNTAIGLTPDVPTVNPDGTIGGPSGYNGSSYNPNPVAAAQLNTNVVKRMQGYGNIYGEIYFAKGLTLRNEISGNFDYGNTNQFMPTFVVNGVLNPNNSASINDVNNKSLTVRNYLTYNHLFKELYSLNAMVGHESSSGTYTYLSASRTGFLSNSPTDLDLGDATTSVNGGGNSDWANESYFGRVTLGYQSLLLTGNIRRDGNSNFSPTNRWNTTYSFAGAWDLTKDLLKSVTAMNQLKLRAGYGLTNNANIGGYKYGSPLQQGLVGLGVGYHVSQISNPDVKWETTTSTNLGVDAGILDNRITLTVDAYTRKTNDLLLTLPLPAFAGTSGTGGANSPVGNVGSIQNKGFEFSLNTQNIKSKNFNWNTTVTFSLNNNKVLSLNTADGAFYTIIDNGGVTVAKTAVGRSIGEFYGYVANGVFKDAKDLTDSPKPAGSNIDRTTGIWVGDVKFKDISGPEGKPDGVINELDMTYLGSPLPKFQYGFSNTFSYKGFDLTLFINGNYGNKILNYLKTKHENPNSGATGYFVGLNDYAHLGLIDPTGSATDVNNVYVTNPNTTLPGFRVSGDPNQSFRPSSLFIEDGSYIRLKNIVLGYNLPAKWISKIHAASVRVYANVQNVFTITKYSGYDPEIGNTGIGAGIDYGRYPSARVYTFGFAIGLQ